MRGAAVVQGARTVDLLVEATRKGMTVERVEMNGAAAVSTELI